MYTRCLRPRIERALKLHPVVFLQGPRRVGKTTLVRAMAEERGALYRSLDDLASLGLARRDPAGFVAGLQLPVVLDEAQRVPELLLAIKERVDRGVPKGAFLLTGSSPLLTLPRLADALTGRMAILTLWPLTQAERAGSCFDLFERIENPPRQVGPAPFQSALEAGGFPEVQDLAPEDRVVWWEAYVQTVLERDVRELSDVGDVDALYRFIRYAAAHTATLVNKSAWARELGFSVPRVDRYLGLFRRLFLLLLLPAWSPNPGKRVTRQPKLALSDPGLYTHLIGGAGDPGRGFENFAAIEILRHAGFGKEPLRPYHLRTHSGREVDLILEARDGRLFAFAFKARRSLAPADFRHLLWLKDELGEDRVRGYVVYTGEETILHKGVWALPVGVFWP